MRFWRRRRPSVVRLAGRFLLHRPGHPRGVGPGRDLNADRLPYLVTVGTTAAIGARAWLRVCNYWYRSRRLRSRMPHEGWVRSTPNCAILS